MSITAETQAPSKETLMIAGLKAPVEINIDKWGVPHIKAQSLPDLFFAQGFNAARDRLWQIDLARKRGLGLLAADFGPGYLAQDRAARLLLYRGDMDAEWACYGADSKMICSSFANGINAYIDLIAKDPKRMPPEFTQMGTRPAKWAAEDVVRIRTHGWVRNALSEIVRANVMAKSDANTDLLRQNLEPHVEPHVAKEIDLRSIPLAVLDVYKLAIAGVTFRDDRLQAPIAQAGAWTKVTPLGEVVADAAFQGPISWAVADGSNNWAVEGKRTATGRPILANDPHRAHAVPSLRYLVHLTAPGFDAIGTGEPILPGIMVGHNGHSAFGLTLFFGPDEEDVYVYETKPGNPNSYRYKGGWEDMRIIEESVDVKGAPKQKLVMKFTRHGPIIFEDEKLHRAYGIRSVVTEPGTTPYGASLISMRSRSFEDFRKAMRNWAVPAVSQVYADVKGDIGWITAGFTPIRGNWDGLLPVPGDGQYEWKGFLDGEQMPWVRNPAKGFVATANEMNVPKDWPNKASEYGFEWWEPSRAMRVHEVLGSQPKHSVEDSKALQTDSFTVPARRIKPLLAGLKSSDPDAASALDLLKGWDCRLLADSGPAALFELWWSTHLKPAFFAQVVPNPEVRAFLMAPGDVESIVSSLEKPAARLGSESARNTLLLSTLSSAYRDAVKRMGNDPRSWSWGKLHQGYFAHALTALKSTKEPKQMTVGPLTKGGGDSTPMMAAYRPTDFRVYLGASVRIVVDVGDWDKSQWSNSPGQSGDPRSPHYGDLAPLWAKGEYFPMLYSQAAIEAVTERRIVLNPGKA
jgi:penicillin G amidase